MTTKTHNVLSKRQRRRKLERILALVSIGVIAAVWVIGSRRAEASLMPAIQESLPEANHFKKQADGFYAAYADETEQDLLGYVALGQADGYGGPLTMAVAVDPAGNILNAVIANSKETPAWAAKVTDSKLLGSLAGKAYSDPFKIGEDLDGVTGATYTSRAVANAALNGSQAAARQLGLPVQSAPPPNIQFGVPEIVLFVLFATGYIGHQRNFKFTKQARWGSMFVGLIVLGFIYSSPLTIAYISKLILGYWPQWQTNLYFYMLVGGVLFVFLIDNKNPYCEWFCPFGAAQECLGVIGGAKPRKSRRLIEPLKWVQRWMALAAILLGVYFRSPGLASYELFGTLFKFVGSSLQFIALGIVIITSLFILRPWCNYLCPVHPVVDIVRLFREWAKEIWLKINPKTRTA